MIKITKKLKRNNFKSQTFQVFTKQEAKEQGLKWKHWGGDNTWRYDEFGQDETTACGDWGEEPTEYRYDLTHMMYDQDFPSLRETKLADGKQGVRTENCYIVFNINNINIIPII